MPSLKCSLVGDSAISSFLSNYLMVRAKSSEVSVFRIILTLGLSASFEESFENKQVNSSTRATYYFQRMFQGSLLVFENIRMLQVISMQLGNDPWRQSCYHGVNIFKVHCTPQLSADEALIWGIRGIKGTINLGIKSVPVKQGFDHLHRYWGLCFHKGSLSGASEDLL